MQTATASAEAAPSQVKWGRFFRHYIEMVVAMFVGMGVGGLIFMPILDAMNLTIREARIQYPELYVIAMALTMTAPMVAWMRYRGHGWRSCWEMTTAMVVPGIFILCLYWLQVTSGPGCTLYCALMTPAMLIPMFYRREEYGHNHRHHRRLSLGT